MRPKQSPNHLSTIIVRLWYLGQCFKVNRLLVAYSWIWFPYSKCLGPPETIVSGFFSFYTYSENKLYTLSFQSIEHSCSIHASATDTVHTTIWLDDSFKHTIRFDMLHCVCALHEPKFSEKTKFRSHKPVELAYTCMSWLEGSWKCSYGSNQVASANSKVEHTYLIITQIRTVWNGSSLSWQSCM